MRNMLGGRWSLLVLLGLGLVVAGCGSSSSSSSSTTSSQAAAPALTKTEYVKQGNAICKAGTAKQQADIAAYSKAHHLSGKATPTKAQETQVAAIGASNIQAQINAVKALVPPSAGKAQVTAMLAAAQQDLGRVKQNPALLFGNTNPFAHSGKLLHAYGLTSCAPNN
jgi:hypothetical protein